MRKVGVHAEERELLDALEKGEYESLLTDARRGELEKCANETFKKDKRINIRISARDLAAIQVRASEAGMPYQTLVSSILHKYISGSLHDVTSRNTNQRKA